MRHAPPPPTASWDDRRHDAAIAFEGARTRLAAIEAERPAVTSDPMAQPHVDHALSIHGGSVRLRSASGPMEALWIDLRDPEGREVIFDRATQQHLAAAVRLTPAHARELAALLIRYADTHAETPE